MRILFSAIVLLALHSVATAQPDSLRSTPIEPPPEKPAESRTQGVLWVGPTYKNNWGLEGGLRYGWFGFALGFPDLSYSDKRPSAESVRNYDVPHEAYTTITYRGGYLGALAIGFYEFGPALSVYGGAGPYWKSTVYLDRSDATGWYYHNTRSPEWHDAELGLTVGAQFTLFDHLVLAASFNNIAGIGAFIGFR